MLDSPVFKIVYAIRMATRKNEMGKRQRKCYRNGNMQGGALGNGYNNGPEMLARGYPEIASYNSCGAVSRAGTMTTAQISNFSGGLPGISLNGGSRKRRQRKSHSRRMHKGRKHRGTRRMHGGRYTMSMLGPEFEAAGPRGGMMATAERTHCESGISPHVSQTTPTAPALRGGALQLAPSPVMNGGGALQLAPTPFLQEQTAGYTQLPSDFVGQTNAPIMLNIPAAGRVEVPACAQTGGRRHKHRKAYRKSSRKHRKTHRKHRKSSRKH
jgi:hypothetical protein